MKKNFEELYEYLFGVANAEIVPTYAGRLPAFIFAPVTYLDSADGRIEQILLEYLDAERTNYDYAGTTIDEAINAGEVVAARLEKLHETVKALDNLINSAQGEMIKVFETGFSDGSLTDNLKAEGESIKTKIRKYKWLRILFTDIKKILVGDFKKQTEHFKEEYKRELSKRLINARLARGLSIDEISSLLCMTRQGYFKYELAESEPPSFTICKLCKILDTPADYLLGLELKEKME